MRGKKIQPWPWSVQCRQYDGYTGKLSRPRIVDALGKQVSLTNIRQATLAEMLHLQIQSALATNLPMPKELTEAKELIDIAGRV